MSEGGKNKLSLEEADLEAEKMRGILHRRAVVKPDARDYSGADAKVERDRARVEGAEVEPVKNIEDEVKNEVGELKKVLEMETVEAEKTVAKRMAEDYAQAEKKIEDYKLAKYKQIEEGAVGVLEEVGRKLVGKTLNFREHTDFIISALEKAKLQNDI